MTAAPPSGQMPELIDIEEFFADPRFANPSISPDGTRIAYLAPAQGRRNIWIRNIDQTHDDATCVTHDTRRGITTYYWTDNPRWLLYLQDTDGNEDWHLYRVDLDAPDQPAVDLTPMDPGSRVVGADPLPSVPGSVLVTMNRRPTFFDVFRIDVASGETTLHREQDDPTDAVLFDRGGEPAFRTALTSDGALEISAIDPATGQKRLLRRLGGAEHPMGVQPQEVTADGKPERYRLTAVRTSTRRRGPQGAVRCRVRPKRNVRRRGVIRVSLAGIRVGHCDTEHR